MKAENKQLLLQLLQQHKDLGISNQIDYDKFYLYSIITHSTAIEGSKMVDKADLIKEMVDKWSIKPSLAEKMVDILLFMADKEEIKTETIVRAFGFTETTAKRYLRQLAEFGYIEAHGGNRNRSYTKIQPVSDTHEFKLRGPDGKMRNY